MLSARGFFFVAAFCVAVALAPSPLRAQAGTGSISGNVSDHQGSPLAGAKVTLTNDSTKQSTGGSTDGTGGYSFDGLKPGRYTVVFEVPGLVTKTETVTIKAGKKVKVSERLKPPLPPKSKSDD